MSQANSALCKTPAHKFSESAYFSQALTIDAGLVSLLMKRQQPSSGTDFLLEGTALDIAGHSFDKID